MDFIERLFGIFSGGRSGALEALYVVAILVLLLIPTWRLLGQRRGRQHR
jgi:hypothetical protein